MSGETLSELFLSLNVAQTIPPSQPDDLCRAVRRVAPGLPHAPLAEPYTAKLYSLRPLSPFGLMTAVPRLGHSGPGPCGKSSILRWEVRHEI